MSLTVDEPVVARRGDALKDNIFHSSVAPNTGPYYNVQEANWYSFYVGDL
jgi:hypothetical protein